MKSTNQKLKRATKVQNLEITYKSEFRERLVQKLEKRKKWRNFLLAMILVLNLKLITNRQRLKA